MNKFLNKIIDLWLEKYGDKTINKINLAYRSVTSVPTVYNVCNRESYNLYVINQMWKDLEECMTDEDKLQIIVILNLM